MVNVLYGKCSYCGEISNDLHKVNEDLYNLFQEHKRYTRNALFCAVCIDRAQKKVDRRKRNESIRSGDDRSRSISTVDNSSEPIHPRRNVARRTGGRPGQRPANQPTSPRAGPSRQPPSPRAGPSRQPASPRAGPSRQPTSPRAGPSRQPTSPRAGPSRKPASPRAGPSRQPTPPRETNRSPAKAAPRATRNQPQPNASPAGRNSINNHSIPNRTDDSSQGTTDSSTSGGDPNTQQHPGDNRQTPPTRHVQPNRPLNPDQMRGMSNSERNLHFNQFIRGAGG